MRNIFERYDINEISKVERLYKKYKNMLYFVAIKILHEHYLAEDAVQGSFVKVMKHLDKIDERDEISARRFLAIICKNISISIYRKRLYLNKKCSAEDLNLEIAPKGGNPEEKAIEQEGFSKLNSQIRSLPVLYWDIIDLKICI